MFEQSLAVMNTNMKRLLTLFEAQSAKAASAPSPPAQASSPVQVQEPPLTLIQMPPPSVPMAPV